MPRCHRPTFKLTAIPAASKPRKFRVTSTANAGAGRAVRRINNRHEGGGGDTVMLAVNVVQSNANFAPILNPATVPVQCCTRMGIQNSAPHGRISTIVPRGTFTLHVRPTP